MKLKSLILGSVAAAGLSTAGFAADLGVLTSLDVCDSLGISGLTISSSDNCLAISGKVIYEFNWGDFAGNWDGGVPFINSAAGARNVMDNDGLAPANNDWNSKVETWLKFVGTASSDFGPASATIKIKNVSHQVYQNEAPVAPGKTAPWGAAVAGAGGDETFGWIMDEAFVQVGDTTTLMAGKKGTIANRDDDEPFNWLGLFNSDAVDKGVLGAPAPGVAFPALGGHVIQVVSNLGNGVTIKGGLEKLETTGTAVGVLEYAGSGITAHLTLAAADVLTGTVGNWGAHAGFTGTFDQFKIRGAGAWTSTAAGVTYYNVLASGEAKFDMFTIALSGEATGGSVAPTQVGFGGSVGATVTEGVKINLGGRWFDENTAVNDTEGYQIAAQLVAAVTESVELTGEVGVYGTNKPAAVEATDFYAKASVGWKPGGQFESSLGAEIHQNGAYKVTFKASKEFK